MRPRISPPSARRSKAKAVIRGADGERVVDMEDFHVGPYTTAVGDGEILTEVRIPLRPGCGSAHEKVERRAGDWAIVAASAAVWIENGEIADVGSRSPRSGSRRSTSRAPRSSCAGRPRRTSCSGRRVRSPRRTAHRRRTVEGRSTTSAISRACSRTRALSRATARAAADWRPDMNVSIAINGEHGLPRDRAAPAPRALHPRDA